MPEVLVPVARWPRWIANFAASHGEPALTVRDGGLQGVAPDGSHFVANLPFSRRYADRADVEALAGQVSTPARWGVLLVRKGGYAIAAMDGSTLSASKVGQRHVQGRTAAGGQSQQRFARRRGNQARAAFEAAADHAVRVLDGVTTVVTGGDRAAVDDVLSDPRLSRLVVVGPWFAVADPRRSVLDGVIADAQALVVEVVNAPRD